MAAAATTFITTTWRISGTRRLATIPEHRATAAVHRHLILRIQDTPVPWDHSVRNPFVSVFLLSGFLYPLFLERPTREKLLLFREIPLSAGYILAYQAKYPRVMVSFLCVCIWSAPCFCYSWGHSEAVCRSRQRGGMVGGCRSLSRYICLDVCKGSRVTRIKTTRAQIPQYVVQQTSDNISKVVSWLRRHLTRGYKTSRTN